MEVELASSQRRSPFGEQGPQGFGGTQKGAQGRIEGKGEATERGTNGKEADLTRNLIVESVDTGAGIDRKVCRMTGAWVGGERNTVAPYNPGISVARRRAALGCAAKKMTTPTMSPTSTLIIDEVSFRDVVRVSSIHGSIQWG